jgi:MFS family permease
MSATPIDSTVRVATPAQTERAWRYDGWRVAVAASAGVFVWSLPPFSFAVFLKPIADDFHLSRQTVSAAFGLSALIAACFAAPAGYLVDRVGARTVLLPSLTVAALTFTLRAFLTPALWHIGVLFALTGLFGLGAGPVAYGRLVSTWFEARRGQALGVMMAGAAVGAMVHPVVAQALIDRVGWRNAQLVLGIGMFVVGVPIVARFVRARGGPRAHASHHTVAVGATARQALGSRMFWILAAALFCDSVANGSLTVHLPALLSDRGVDATGSALALSAMGASALVGRLLAGWLLDRFFAVYISVALLVVAATGLVILTQAETLGGGALGAALVGVGMGGEADVTPYLLTRYYGLRSFSTLYGAMFMMTAIAWAIGPSLMGRSFDANGTYVPHLQLMAVLLAGAAVAMLTLPRYALPVPETPHGDV